MALCLRRFPSRKPADRATFRADPPWLEIKGYRDEKSILGVGQAQVGAELSVPRTVAVPLALAVEVMTGKFCRRFAPSSPSPASFGVTP